MDTPQTPTPQQPTPQQPAPKKTSPLVWVGIGCGALLIIAVVLFLVGTYVIGKKVKQMADHPETSVVKMMIAANPDLKLVSIDEKEGKVTVKNTKTGETITMDFSDIKNGKFDVKNEKGEGLSVRGGEAEGKITIKSEDNTVTINANQNGTPSWVPTYPGAKRGEGMTTSSDEGKAGTIMMTTGDDPKTVITTLETLLKGKGYTVTTNTFTQNAKTSGGLVMGEKKGEGRSVSIAISSENDQTTIVETYNEESS